MSGAVDYKQIWANAEAKASALEGGEAPQAPETASVAEQAPETADEAPEPELEGKPTPKERAEFRAWKRKQRERVEAERRQVSELAQAKLEELKPLVAIGDALKSRDLNSFAKLVGQQIGVEIADWAGLNKHVLRQHSSPEYQEVQELRRKVQEREEYERKEREQSEQRQRQEAQQRAQLEYQRNLQIELKGVDGPAGILADDAEFVRAVFNIQMREYDASSDTTISAEEAAEEVLEIARKRYELQHKAFNGARATTKPETAKPPGAPAKGKPARSKTVSTARSVEASASGPAKTDSAWKAKYAAMLQVGD